MVKGKLKKQGIHRNTEEYTAFSLCTSKVYKSI